jgi:hypothetical protein
VHAIFILCTAVQLSQARQVIRAMEFSGLEIDVDFYAKLVDEAMQLHENKGRAVALDRFKFWLGMPNDYYNS